MITGATGLIGTMITTVLAEANHDLNLQLNILAYVRDKKKAEQIFKYDEITYITGDICHVPPIFEAVDYIIHCAAVTRSKDMVTYPVETFLISLEGTKQILELAKEKRIQSMVYLSSMEMYGTNPLAWYDFDKNQEDRVTENQLGYLDLSHPRTCYPEGKRGAECLCNAYWSEYGIPVKMARLAQTFGAGVSKTENRVFAQFAKSAVRGEDIILHTDGSSEGNYCYLADAVYAIFLLLLQGKNGEAYNVVNEALHMTILQMAELVAAQVADNRIDVVVDLPDTKEQYGYAPAVKLHLSSEKLEKLGWKAHYEMKDMYERMIYNWKEQETIT